MNMIVLLTVLLLLSFYLGSFTIFDIIQGQFCNFWVIFFSLLVFALFKKNNIFSVLHFCIKCIDTYRRACPIHKEHKIFK